MNGIYLTAPEFARRIGIHIQTVRIWDKTEKLKAHHITPGGHRYYSKQQVDDYLNGKYGNLGKGH